MPGTLYKIARLKKNLIGGRNRGGNMRFVKCSRECPGGAVYITPLIAISWERAWLEVWFGWGRILFVWQICPLDIKEGEQLRTTKKV